MSIDGLVPEYIKNLAIYKAGKPIAELAQERGLKESEITKLASNENPLGPSPKAIACLKSEFSKLHLYPDMHALKLRTKLAELYQLKLENIILGNGSEGIMSYIVRTFVRPGDEILTSDRTFIGFLILVRAVGGNLKLVPQIPEYKYDVDKLVESINPKTKLIYVANPNNPTGTYLTKNEFDRLMKKVPDHCLVILDEAYYEYAKEITDYPDSMDFRYDNVITLRTFSKAYGLAGLRVGYGFAHEDLIGNLIKVKLPFEPNSLAQAAAFHALSDTEHLQKTLEMNKTNYPRLENILSGHGFKTIPSAANFITVETGSEQASSWLFLKLLDHGVIIRPLASNDMPDYIRISIGTKNDLDHLEAAMEQVMPEYQQKFRN